MRRIIFHSVVGYIVLGRKVPKILNVIFRVISLNETKLTADEWMVFKSVQNSNYINDPVLRQLILLCIEGR